MTVFSLTLIGPSSANAYDANLTKKLSGRILLQVQQNGEAWYVRPSNLQRYYLKDGAAAYDMMRNMGLGITDSDLAKIPKVDSATAMNQSVSICTSNTLANRLRGQILLQVQQHGEAWYIDAVKCRAIYMKDGAAAYQIMRYLGLGITDSDLAKIQSNSSTNTNSQNTQAPQDKKTGPVAADNNQYSLAQAMSDNAQLSTIAFSGLAFITGSAGADTFFPPGKVADFFGFQYMRDVDVAGYGHNTTFLSRVANNVLYILNDTQKAKLLALAKEQAPLYASFAYNRLPISNAFRRNLEGNIPSGTTGLSTQAVSEYTAVLYKTDADLSYNRALVVGGIIQSLDATQKAYLEKMKFNDYSSWPAVTEDETLKKSMTNDEFVAVMTYASELFSWYKGSIEADVYFCPERHGTYFGGFYMKDYPAMNDPNYFIDTAITGDSGQNFLNTLDTTQRALITSIIDEQRAALAEIAQIRTTVSTELLKAMNGGTVDKTKVYSLIERYGELDGQMSALYASRFAAVNKTLTATQRTALVKLRNLTVVPSGVYKFSTPLATPTLPNTDFMFGVGSIPSDAGQTTPPASFLITSKTGK